jgi:parallel beta-helix repeat protein
VRALHGGDTLYLRGGTYDRQSIGQYGPTPVPNGTSWETATTIAAYPGEAVWLIYANIGMINGNSYIIFDGLHFDNGGLYLDGSAHHIRFQNGEFTNTGPGDANMYIQGSPGASYLEVLHTKIHNAGGGVNGTGCTNPEYGCYGMYWSGHHGLFDGNEVYNNAHYGFHIYHGSQNDVTDNVVRNNVFYGNGLDESRGLTTCAMIISTGPNNQAYNNIVYGNKCGIQVDYRCHNCEVYNNTVYGNHLTGISVSGSNNAVIKNNLVYDNGSAIQDSGTGTIVANNWTDSNGNPRFVNAAANDFRLQSTSPAIDAGVTLSAVPTDLTGLARPQGARYDIGAYEYQVSTVPIPVPAPKNLRQLQ